LRRAAGFNPPLFYARGFPQFTGDLVWIDASRPSPSSLVAGAMDRAMMDTAEGHGEFIAGPAAECARLQVTKMMRVGWPATADKARLFGDIAKVLSIAITPWGGNGEDALVDADRLVRLGTCGPARLLLTICIGNCRSVIVRGTCSS
jgi:hypothetical protein